MQTVFITGVGKGIGKHLAEKFLQEGFKVIGTFRSGDAPVAREHFQSYKLELSDPQSVSACVEAVRKSGADIDIFINNAAALLDEDETQVVVSKLRETLEINVIGTIDITEQLIPLIVPGGHIINISSTAGSLALAGPVTESASHYPYHYPAYKISKAALNMYTRTLALRLAPKKITVSSVHPGWVQTDMGGEDAKISPEKAAEGIFNIAVKKPLTGGFWFGEENVPW